MKRFLHPVTLLLLLSNCQRDQPQPAPEPTFTGRWLLQSFAIYEYDSTGTQQGTPTVYNVSQAGRYLIVTDTSLQQFKSDGTVILPRYHYARTDSVLTFTTTHSYFTTITKLTATELAIREKAAARRGSRRIFIAEENRYLRE